jgi:internalin A
LTFGQFRDLCAQHDVIDRADQDALASILNVLGIALNYADDARLRDTHVLNPHWITSGIYAILNSPLLASKRGELDVADLPRILDGAAYPPEMHEFLLELLRKFDLCFRFPEPRDHTFLIPQLLGKEEPDLGNEFEPLACLNFRYDYPVWPEGLLPRFVVRTHALSVSQPRWRTGVVLEFEGNRALVRAEPRDKHVIISIGGPTDGRRQLLAIIRSDFERIHADIPRLAPVASVPLPDAPSEVIRYDELTGLKQSGITSVTRVVGESPVSHAVSSLLAAVDVPSGSIGRPIKLFVSYSHKDEQFREQLDTHLKLFERMGLVARWDDRRIPPGAEWKGEVDLNLKTADLILLLVSSDFFASDYAFNIEMREALQRHDAGTARVVPIIVRDCSWDLAPFARLQALPKDGQPVSLWANRDSAWSNVAEELKKMITGGVAA